MDEILNYDEWIAQSTKIETKFLAEYDIDTGQVSRVGPAHAFMNSKYTIEVDEDTAEDIINGKIKIQSCFVDITDKKLEISEVKQVYKLDDVLHRIVSRKWTDIEKPDIHITQEGNKLIFRLTEEYGGTYRQDEKFQPVKQRKIRWDGDTSLNFLVTDYNDPNILYEMITITVDDLLGKDRVIELDVLPEKFSIYTRRIFKDYVIE